jgi:hypothetical protein
MPLRKLIEVFGKIKIEEKWPRREEMRRRALPREGNVEDGVGGYLLRRWGESTPNWPGIQLAALFLATRISPTLKLLFALLYLLYPSLFPCFTGNQNEYFQLNAYILSMISGHGCSSFPAQPSPGGAS